MRIEEFIVEEQCSIVEVMDKIDKNSKGSIYVINQGKLIGAVTDGDIRRYLLKGGKLEENITAVMNRNVRYLLQEKEKTAEAVLKEEKISSLPIVDLNGYIIKIIFHDFIVEKEKKGLKVPVVIMAGGKGTRLYPYTKILPKPLIPIGEQTITEHIMDHFSAYGCKEYFMIVNHKKSFIKSYFGENRYKEYITYIEEKEFLGTGGGLRLLEKDKINQTFFMTNCDILIDADYSEILSYHKKEKNIITMVCAEKNMVIPYGTIQTTEDNQIVELKEKPEIKFITNTGFYVIEPNLIEMIPERTFIHITDIIQKCMKEGKKVGAYKIQEEQWLDMGQLEELEKMKEKLGII